ncbi:hypothetical protein B7494_g305 [Chlorociboria aeruginascens]|nr:hypothetical protein B7494_g305 [Chlorociboria aeruginascens]
MATLSNPGSADPQILETEHRPTLSRPLKLLSLDGGGVRGLSSIIILEHLMEKVNDERKKKGLAPQEPWELFDLIGGTSTGGLIAVMLGRLHMSVKECRRWYIQLAKEAFTPIYSPFNKVGKLLGKIQAKPVFDAIKLENAIQSIVLSSLKDVKLQSIPKPEIAEKMKGFTSPDSLPSLLFHPDQSEEGCKTFVVAADQSDTQSPLILRSYNNSHRNNDFLNYLLILEACRATSAAPTFFAPLTLKDPETGRQKVLIDGGIVYNNPVTLVHGESQDLWPNTTPLLISLGTGFKDDIEFKGPAWSIAKTLAEMATETEATHNKFKKGSGKELVSKNKYFRFNVPKIAATGMEEYKKLEYLERETMNYISNHTALTDACVEKLLETASPETIQRNKSIIRWISRTSYRSDHSQVGDQIDTSHMTNGLWLLNDHFIPWTKSKQSAKPVFWLLGSVGMGKTCLMYQIIEHCKKTLQPGSQLAFFYCSQASHDDRQDPTDILRSILAQLSCTKDFSMIAPGVLKAYEEREATGGLDAKFSIKETTDLLRQIVSREHHHPYTITIIIDGLNECNDFNKLLFYFKKIFDDDSGNGSLKLVLSSRMNVQPSPNFPSRKEIVISPENNADDIKAYIDCQVSHREKYNHGKRLLDGSKEGRLLEEKLYLALSSKAEGMFLWVKLQIATFFPRNQDLRNGKDIRRKIENLETPPDLETVYKEVYDTNSEPGSEDLKVAENVYKWMLSIKRNFSVEDLVEAVFPRSLGTAEMDEKLRLVDYIRRVCANFIILSESGADSSTSEMLESNAPETKVKTVQFAHATVNDYLKSRPEGEYTKKSTHGHIAESCLSYLRGVRRENAREAREDRGFLNYALAYWPYHLSEACANGYDISIVETASKFTDEDFEEWINVLRPIALNLFQDSVTQEKLLDCISDPTDRIFLACAWNIFDLVKELIDTRVASGALNVQYLNRTNINRATPLYLASKYGYRKIVDFLIRNNAEVNFECMKGDGALEVASKGGHSSIIRLLLDSGAKVAAHGGNAIIQAASKGHIEILKLLIVNFEEEAKNDKYLLSAVFLDSLVEGAENGKAEVVRIILEKRGSFKVNNSFFAAAIETALIQAADVGSENVINRLLEERSHHDNIRDEDGASLLEIAAANGHFTVVKSLILKGSNLEDFGHSALSLAAESDHLTIVKLLLEEGVALSFSNLRDLEILQKAVENGYGEITNLLLAHINQGTYGESLSRAAKDGDVSVVNLLLSLGTMNDVKTLHKQAADGHELAMQHLLSYDAEHPEELSSLQKAAEEGHDLVVKFLLENDANIAVGAKEDSALHKAISKNRPTIVKMLLAYDADANALGFSGAPLLLATQDGYEQIIDLLLARGANLNVENENGTALEIAARQGYLRIVERLISGHLNATNNVHTQSLKEILNRRGPQGTVLQCAAAGGHREIVNLLLKQGADVDIQSGPYGTALQAAVEEGNVDVVKILRSAKATDFSCGGDNTWDKVTSTWVPTVPYELQPPPPANGNRSITPSPHLEPETLLISIATVNERQKKKEKKIVSFHETASSVGRSSSIINMNGLGSSRVQMVSNRRRGSNSSRGISSLMSPPAYSPERSPSSPSSPRNSYSRRSSTKSTNGY